MQILLVSDTHIPKRARELDPAFVERAREADLVAHAGDLTTMDVLKTLQSLSYTVAVHGNMDSPAVMHTLPDKLVISLEGYHLGLIHGDRPAEIERAYLEGGVDYDSPQMQPFYRYLAAQLPAAEIIVFGHFHAPVVRTWEGRLLINPGALSAARWPGSFAVLDLAAGVEPRAAIVEL